MPFWTDEFIPAALLTIDEVLWVIAQSGGGSVPQTDVFTGPATSVTLTHTATGTTMTLMHVYRGGSRQVLGIGNDYTATNTVVTPNTPLSTGEILVVDYSHN